MQITETPLDQLSLDTRNANLGTDRGRVALRESLARYGAGRSILLDRDGRVIAGNKTLEAARALGHDGVLIVKTDGTKLVAVQRTDLDLEEDTDARELGVGDNRIAEIDLDWDIAQIDALIEEGADITSLFSDTELDALRRSVVTPSPDAFPEVGEDIPVAHTCPRCGFAFS